MTTVTGGVQLVDRDSGTGIFDCIKFVGAVAIRADGSPLVPLLHFLIMLGTEVFYGMTLVTAQTALDGEYPPVGGEHITAFGLFMR
jgi:hypothetical protein